MAVHERVWERGPDPRRRMEMPMRTWHPKGTYGLLIAMVAVYVLELVAQGFLSEAEFTWAFTITPVWWLQPWSLVVSTMSHGDVIHILFNGLILFFFGPLLERMLGTAKFLALFLVAGAISGILQVTLEAAPALGASGAIMMVFGALVMIMPHEKLLVWGIVPVPFWAAGVGYAIFDLMGTFNPESTIGHFAHLSGMALGLWLGWDIKQRRGQQVSRFAV